MYACMKVYYMFSDTFKHFSDDFLVARAAKCANSFEKRFPTKGDEAQKRAKMLTTVYRAVTPRVKRTVDLASQPPVNFFDELQK